MYVYSGRKKNKRISLTPFTFGQICKKNINIYEEEKSNKVNVFQFVSRWIVVIPATM